MKDKDAGDYELDLLEEGTFVLEPDDPKWSTLTGTWSDPKGKGKKFVLALDAQSRQELLDDLSQAASDASGTNQTVAYKGGKAPKVKAFADAAREAGLEF